MPLPSQENAFVNREKIVRFFLEPFAEREKGCPGKADPFFRAASIRSVVNGSTAVAALRSFPPVSRKNARAFILGKILDGG